ncbi:MAG: VOC family protein [Desulfobacterales bacterium]|nr:MAG: VOC family protein [Desulfobacterales bacterium]
MFLRHVGLACSTEDNADKFYRDLLGLNKSEPKTLPSDLSRAIFNVDAELQIIDYMEEKVHFEIFITGLVGNPSRQIAHQCLEVDALSDFIEKCRTLKVEISQIPKGDKVLTFIKDFDGNLFEIKGSS